MLAECDTGAQGTPQIVAVWTSVHAHQDPTERGRAEGLVFSEIRWAIIPGSAGSHGSVFLRTAKDGQARVSYN